MPSAERCCLSEEKDLELHKSIQIAFQKALDAHGYGFQYAVLSTAHELATSGWTQWRFDASEFPVQVQDATTKIDFILRLGDTNTCLVCECKRANPALARWCFVRAPYERRDYSEELLIEKVTSHSVLGTPEATAHIFAHNPEPYHVGIEVKTTSGGEPTDKGRGAIEEAAGQVLRGTNGLVDLLQLKRDLFDGLKPWFFIPAIFTTAELFVSDVLLHRSDLETGKAKWSGTTLNRKEWIALNYHVSPGLKHHVPPALRSTNLSSLLRSEHTRTIFIVNAKGAASFLKWCAQQG